MVPIFLLFLYATYLSFFIQGFCLGSFVTRFMIQEVLSVEMKVYETLSMLKTDMPWMWSKIYSPKLLIVGV